MSGVDGHEKHPHIVIRADRGEQVIQRIQPQGILENLVMKMRCERVSGHPDLADILSPRQFLSFGDTGVLKVGITCKIAVAVVDRETESLREMMKKSYEILKNHTLNIERKKKGLNPANSCWFWGAGTKPALSSFEEKTGKKGVMISAVDLLKGIAVGAGMDNIIVPGADGTLNTNYEGKANAAIKALTEDGYDFAYIHVEAPDEMGHQGSVERKIKAVENLDGRVIKTVVEGLKKSGEPFRVIVTPDHPTPIRLRTHVAKPVPYLLYDSTEELDRTWNYNEAEAEASKNYVANGHQLIDKLFEK